MSSLKRKAAAPLTLKAWRASRKFTLQQAADFLGVSLTAYFHMERDGQRPRPDTMKRIMDLTGVSADVLAGVA
jgi:transcriptional regulator with XRE-family HTH domain